MWVQHLSAERSATANAAASQGGVRDSWSVAPPGADPKTAAAVRSRAASCAAGAAAASCSWALSSPSHTCRYAVHIGLC